MNVEFDLVFTVDQIFTGRVKSFQPTKTVLLLDYRKKLRYSAEKKTLNEINYRSSWKFITVTLTKPSILEAG